MIKKRTIKDFTGEILLKRLAIKYLVLKTTRNYGQELYDKNAHGQRELPFFAQPDETGDLELYATNDFAIFIVGYYLGQGYKLNDIVFLRSHYDGWEDAGSDSGTEPGDEITDDGDDGNGSSQGGSDGSIN